MYVEIKGLDRLQAAFEEFPDIVNDEMSAAIEKSLLSLIPPLARYPPPRPNQKYRRTKTLGRRWTAQTPNISRTGSGLTGQIGNATPYAWSVQGKAQAWMHKGRWPTVKQVVDNSDIESILEEGIDSAILRVIQELQ